MHHYGATWFELNEEWPWKRVLLAHEHSRELELKRNFSVAQLTRMFISANSRSGASIPSIEKLMPPWAQPYKHVEAVYSWDAVQDFTLALKLGFITGASLQAFNTNLLRASGWKG